MKAVKKIRKKETRNFKYLRGNVKNMTDPKTWWLISDEDVQAIRKGLTDPIALHALDSGLHLTDAVPKDWGEEDEKT